MTSYAIELEISEGVVLGGVRRVTWHVAEQDDWISATAVPGAQIEDEKSRPGTIWRRRVLVQLPLGAELMRVDSEPDRERSADPLAYFWGSPRPHRRIVRRSYFRVGQGGQLLRLAHQR